jgi:uncharacterized protein YndB with AHSA1/START domain
MAGKNKSNVLKLERSYDAPAKTVWDAWTDPVQAAQWWGPRGFTITTHSKDFRAGGQWVYTMHGPDGTDYPNIATYLEIENHSRLVYDHGAQPGKPPLFRVTVDFTENNGKTLMKMQMALPTPEAAEETRKFIKKAGGEATWDRLAEYLGSKTSGQERFVINRSFEAPIQTLFQMWTDPAHFQEWLPPTGFTMKILEGQIQPGGSAFYAMTDGKDVTMYGRTHYLEIKKPSHLIYTQQFCNPDGTVSRHPFAPTWPETMKTTVVFTAESAEQTRITVMWEPYGAVIAEELRTFVQARSGMTQGWTGSFDKLESYLTKA